MSLVQVNWTRWKDDPDNAPAWDTHAKNAERLKTALMPPMDQAYSALLEDLLARGMLDDTLVIWMGEFGRSPGTIPAEDETTGAMYSAVHWPAVEYKVVWSTVFRTAKVLILWTVVSNPRT